MVCHSAALCDERYNDGGRRRTSIGAGGDAETVAVEREQEPTDHEEGVGENDELISLVQQPAELEEAVKSRDEEDMSVLEIAHHSFCFSPPKRDPKLSDEEQQDEAKRPKSPEREGVQLAEQHGSRGEGGGEMDIYPLQVER